MLIPKEFLICFSCFFSLFFRTIHRVYDKMRLSEERQERRLKMESYSIEDIELLRKKSGLSYQEAVALLDYHNGDLARALIDLEKSGRLKEETTMNNHETKQTREKDGTHGEVRTKALNILQRLYRSRIKVAKGETAVVNLSVLFGGACLLLAPHMTIAGIIISMLLGYKFSFSNMDAAFSSDSLERMVRNAAQNARSSVTSVVQSFSGEKNSSVANSSQPSAETESRKEPSQIVKTVTAQNIVETGQEDPAESLRKQTKEIEQTLDSFFDSNPAATTYHSAYSAAASSVPTIQVPVQTDTREGTVRVDSDHDGYSSVTIG